jgi:hypothetical protein
VAFVDRLRHLQCEPEALDLHVSRRGPVDRTVVLVRFASVPSAVDEAVDQATSVAEQLRGSVEVAAGPEAEAWWSSQRAVPSDRSLAHVRLAWKPAELARVADVLTAATRGLDFDLVGRAAIGAAVLRVGGDTTRQVEAVRALRASSACRHVVVIDGPRDLRQQIDVWGTDSAAQPLWAALKDACDPCDTLGAGRGPL